VGGSKVYPYGSTGAVRAHVLAALGVLKVASPDQIRRLVCPGHQDNKAVRNACLDLARHGLVVSEGSARDGSKLWGLTPLGLDAAGEVLARPASEMGGTARGAARSGAPHAMAVNETVIAITRTAPAPTRPVRRKTTAVSSPRSRRPRPRPRLRRCRRGSVRCRPGRRRWPSICPAVAVTVPRFGRMRCCTRRRRGRRLLLAPEHKPRLRRRNTR